MRESVSDFSGSLYIQTTWVRTRILLDPTNGKKWTNKRRLASHEYAMLSKTIPF